MDISSVNNSTSLPNASWNTSSVQNTPDTQNTPDNSVSTSISQSRLNRPLMRDLVNTVADGTASDSDIADLADKLKQVATNSADTKGILGKFTDGTATTDDVKAMAIKMHDRASDMQAHFGYMSPTDVGAPALPSAMYATRAYSQNSNYFPASTLDYKI